MYLLAILLGGLAGITVSLFLVGVEWHGSIDKGFQINHVQVAIGLIGTLLRFADIKDNVRTFG